MVTSCKLDSQSVVAVPKMNSVRTRKPASSNSNSSGFRLLDGDQLENNSSVSRNSIYKLKIDLMFDDSRSMRSNRLDDPRGSHRTRSIIMYGRSELASTSGDNPRSLSSFLQESSESAKVLAEAAKNDVQRISNSVQAQIEQLFTDVAKDATNSFDVTCLGCLPLKDKVTSLQGLQEPLRQLYLDEMTKKKLKSGYLDICATGLRIKLSAKLNEEENDSSITPFHNIAVWSAVKFVISDSDGGAAFLPLITDPDNIDKTALFQPLSAIEQLAVEQSEHMHAPIFAVVMRSASAPKILECHGFICKSTEDAIVIAATLYQSLMAHVSTNSHRSTKRRTPRQQNGVSCISIASSSALTSSNYLSRSQVAPSLNGRRSSFRSSSAGTGSQMGMGSATPSRSTRKKRVSSSSLSSNSNVINEAAEIETSTEERKRKSHKTKRAPPVPAPNVLGGYSKGAASSSGRSNNIVCNNGHVNRLHHHGQKKPTTPTMPLAMPLPMANGNANARKISDLVGAVGAVSAAGDGDILTRVAIPRSGSFLNTGGLTRYKSRAARRTNSGKLGGGGGGGGFGLVDWHRLNCASSSPLGFSELFNEFRLHENLHSLDDILYAIIDADGMSFNDLKPIYKEFLLKLAVTLTQDELFQRSKNIMRRQKKKKQKRKSSLNGSQKKPKSIFFGTKSLKKVFQLGQFRSCRGKLTKPTHAKDSSATMESSGKRRLTPPIIIGPPTSQSHQQQQRNRAATSGSDVSVVRNEHALQGIHRNSSSGYVSCSECSYDSESCTCASADRCYCSLRTEHLNHKLRQKNERNMAMANARKPAGNAAATAATAGAGNRHSLISCKSDEKCYCSMVEEEPNSTLEHDSANSHSDTTTWCDTDSCVSASKCYCKRTHRRQRVNAAPVSEDSLNQQHRSRASSRKPKPSEKLGLDYELFTIGGNSKPVQPHEALSVKKSVEAAAVFADMKLSQTTDIKSLCPPLMPSGHGQKQSMRQSNASCHSNGSSRRSLYRTRESISTDRLGHGNGNVNAMMMPALHLSSSGASHKSCSADDLLINIKALEKAASIRSSVSRSRMASYQSMRAVSASLEDSLGYLP
ncbi:uncharacterized protein LOC117576200 isoform X1 [Drosophila albomicans]|uniref:Uncharacterized protein LOC117576200 isoform X1 n=1 Tax=Drosophila albomicans TaxID=7291 RepID=A0A9C6SWV4_DROAB|nr:uncharacterized protein LOC117576200 isoform X1 [Drosophila albomicans]XP_051863270.1 uncharacterized protein LOC117576200 isoform X1 [Drosophila albomicans]